MTTRRRLSRGLSEAEAALCEQVTRDVAPLHPRPPQRKRPPAPPPATAEDGRAELKAALAEAAHRPAVAPRRAPPPAGAIDRATQRGLARTELAPSAILDLHGLSETQAHAALLAFIDRAHASGRRTLLVVTGKGRLGAGVLKGQVPRWLAEPPLAGKVRALGPAGPRHGGEGALYVLLRRKA